MMVECNFNSQALEKEVEDGRDGCPRHIIPARVHFRPAVVNDVCSQSVITPRTIHFNRVRASRRLTAILPVRGVFLESFYVG